MRVKHDDMVTSEPTHGEIQASDLSAMNDDFLEWWHSPWRHAQANSSLHEKADIVAMRDRYLISCAELGISPGLPEKFDTAWCRLASLTAESLEYAVRLFTGLIAAQGKDPSSLYHLNAEDKRWCMSIAITQPAKSSPGSITHSDKEYAYRMTGFVELRLHMDAGFPGLWPRIRLSLAEQEYAKSNMWMDENLASVAHAVNAPAFTYQRALRCWRMCQQRAEKIRGHSQA